MKEGSLKGGLPGPPGNQNQIEAERDTMLVSQIAAGSEQALQEIIARYSCQVTRVCLRICRDETEVHGLASEVFWELWRRASTFDASRGSVRAFLLMVARSRSIDCKRSTAARKRVQDKLVQFSVSTPELLLNPLQPSGDSIKAERSARVRDALNGLPLSQQQAIKLAFFDGLTHEEVANHLETPLGTIKSRIRAGLIQLRQVLSEDYETEELP